MLLALLIACGHADAPRQPEPPFAKAPLRATWLLRPGPDLVGVCDASTGVRRPDGGLLVGDDEHSALFPFALDGSPQPPVPLPMGEGELDLEGGARVPGGIWWVASHDRGKGTEPEPPRRHLFRTDDAGAVQQDVTDLWTRLLAHPELGPLLRATEGETSKAIGGFSIEALHADGARLWVGLRAPVVDGKALLVRLQDGASPTVEEVQRYDLGGRGWRALEPHQGVLYGVAGPADDDGDFQLVRVDLATQQADPLAVDFGTLRPEGLVSLPEGLLAISDDGKVDVEGTRCRKLPAAERRARTAWLSPP